VKLNYIREEYLDINKMITKKCVKLYPYPNKKFSFYMELVATCTVGRHLEIT